MPKNGMAGTARNPRKEQKEGKEVSKITTSEYLKLYPCFHWNFAITRQFTGGV
jgi:hypothetical protein